MTLQDLQRKYRELIPNADSIKDPEKEVPRDILMQIKSDIESLNSLREDEVGASSSTGRCFNYWRLLWTADGEKSPEEMAYLQGGCPEHCNPKKGCAGLICICLEATSGFITPSDTTIPQEIMAEEYTRMKTMWNYKMK
jgi:hypothetical protein